MREGKQEVPPSQPGPWRLQQILSPSTGQTVLGPVSPSDGGRGCAEGSW